MRRVGLDSSLPLFFTERKRSRNVSALIFTSQVAAVMERSPSTDAENFRKLTPREREVAELMALGKSNNQIAETMGISVKTLDIHRSKIKVKMNASNDRETTLAVLSAQFKLLVEKE